uniref:(northern house mosquito) hypothetical protein n=1 Tax=Culex pipiens TaxID=7175 RepID=A0A8D8D7D1_CULPI
MRRRTSLTIRRAATSGRAQVVVLEVAEVVLSMSQLITVWLVGGTTTIRRNKSEEVGVKDTNPADQMALPELENEPMHFLVLCFSSAPKHQATRRHHLPEVHILVCRSNINNNHSSLN